MPLQKLCRILENNRLTDTCFELVLEAGELADSAVCGQFVHIKCGEGLLLRRPISICGAEKGRLRLLFDQVGAGTRYLSRQPVGGMLDVLGPVGNGFDVSHEEIIVVGGGIGVPPLLFAAKQAAGNVTALLGFRSKSHVVLTEDFEALGAEVVVTTDDGSAGEAGTVIPPLERLLAARPNARVLTCGPYPMLRAVAALCLAQNRPCQVSLEERMGCGVGACLVCACKVKKPYGDGYGHVCKDGPVFNAGEVVWDA